MDEPIKIMIVCEEYKINMYFNLFKLMLGNEVIRSVNNKHLKEIDTNIAKL